jgi:hypothetical protein
MVATCSRNMYGESASLVDIRIGDCSIDWLFWVSWSLSYPEKQQPQLFWYRNSIVFVNWHLLLLSELSQHWTLCTDQHCVLINIVYWSTLCTHQHCVLINTVYWSTLCIDQHCVLINTVYWSTLYTDQHCTDQHGVLTKIQNSVVLADVRKECHHRISTKVCNVGLNCNSARILAHKTYAKKN